MEKRRIRSCLIQIWYSEDGKEKYRQRLIELGFIEEEQELHNGF